MREPDQSPPGGQSPRKRRPGPRHSANTPLREAVPSPPGERSAGKGRAPRSGGTPLRELDRQVREHYGTWRDQPRGLACAVIAAFMVLTTAAFVFAVVAVVMAMH